MRSLDAGLLAEIAKKAYRFFNAIELQLSTPVYYTDFQYPVYIDSDRYEPYGFKLGKVNHASIMSADKVTLEFDDAGLQMTAMLTAEDVRNKPAILYYGAIGSDYQVIATAEMFRGFIDSWEIKEPTASVTIANEFILWRKKTLRTAQASCPWVFKGTECTYSGVETWCDQSHERCTGLGNNMSFGGFRFLPALMEKEIWWGRIPK